MPPDRDLTTPHPDSALVAAGIVSHDGVLPAWAPALAGAARTVPVGPLHGDAAADVAILARQLAQVDAVLLDAELPSLPQAARRVHDAEPQVQAIIVVPAAARATLERSLLFAPGIGETWFVTPPELDAELLARAADITRRRRQFGRTRARLAEQPVAPHPARRAQVSEAFLSGLLRILPDPVFSADLEGRVLSANDAGSALFASAGCDMRTIPLWHLLRRVEGGEPLAPVAHAETRFEAHVTRTDGGVNVFDVFATPVRVDEMGAWAVVARDLTEQHRTQQQLEEQATELEAQASELEAQQEELIERTAAAERARESADAANAAKSQFLATMSHELRTPLNAILGYSQLLDLQVRGTLNEEQQAFLARLRTSGQHLLSLINDVLDLAKIEAGSTTVRTVRASAAEALRDAIDFAAPQAAARGVELELALPAEAPDVHYAGDPNRVRQVLVNLLSNAVKFTERHGRVSLAAGQSETTPQDGQLTGEGPWTWLRVRDTGIGIPANLQAEVFDPFVQVEGGKTRTAGGTGLGLAISRRLARLMGGDLTLESAPGVGSTFTLWLPAPAASTGEEERPDQRAARAQRRATNHRTRGLRDLGLALRDELEPMLEAFVGRLRADAMFADVRRQPQREMEDHVLAFLANIAQTLVVVDDAGPVTLPADDDTVAILTFVAERHGGQRYRLGWTERQVQREYDLLREEVVMRLRRHEAAAADDVRLAAGVVAHLVAQAATAALAAFRTAGAR